MAVSCNYKLLKNAHIGVGIRMTKNKNTISFANEPMTGMQIENYTKLGFQISHPNMGKSIWVEFKQLPLTKLTIENGKILDEITFVENIVSHQMELIKTNWSEYQELIKLEKEEELEEFITLSEVSPGEVVISALCKEGTSMVYLGTWLTKNVYRKHGRSYGYGRHYNNVSDEFYLLKMSLKRAFFIIDSTELTEKEEEIVSTIKREDFKNPEGNWQESYKLWKNAVDAKKAEIRVNGPKNRFKIISYPVTSKRIKRFVKTGIFNDKFTDSNFNREMILNLSARRDGSYYGNKENQKEFAELKEDYPNVELKDFILTNYGYDCLEGIKFLTINKKDIDKRAYKFINENFKCKLQPKLWVGNSAYHGNYGSLEDFEIE